MQMSALLFAILLAGGNPVWDRQASPGQAQICSERAIPQAGSPLAAGQSRQQVRRIPACPAGAKPLAEAAAPGVQTR